MFGLTRTHGGGVLFLLTIVLSLVGGGFVTLLVGTVAAFAGTHIGSRHMWWRTHVPTGATRSLARLWPWLLSIYLGWAVASWLIGAFFGDVMLRVTPAVTAATPVVLLLTLATAFARDILSAPSLPATAGSPAP